MSGSICGYYFDMIKSNNAKCYLVGIVFYFWTVLFECVLVKIGILDIINKHLNTKNKTGDEMMVLIFHK